MLTGKQKRFLRGARARVESGDNVGKGEISDALVRETNEALETHELIKVKILESCMMDRHEVGRRAVRGMRRGAGPDAGQDAAAVPARLKSRGWSCRRLKLDAPSTSSG